MESGGGVGACGGGDNAAAEVPLRWFCADSTCIVHLFGWLIVYTWLFIALLISIALLIALVYHCTFACMVSCCRHRPPLQKTVTTATTTEKTGGAMPILRTWQQQSV